MSTSQFSPFNCRLTVVLSLEKSACTEKWRVVFCRNNQRSFKPLFCVFRLFMDSRLLANVARFGESGQCETRRPKEAHRRRQMVVSSIPQRGSSTAITLKLHATRNHSRIYFSSRGASDCGSNTFQAEQQHSKYISSERVRGKNGGRLLPTFLLR